MSERAPVEAESAAKPRFMTDEQLRIHFGLSQSALYRLRATSRFPRKDGLVNRTDSRAVDKFFDERARINSPSPAGNPVGLDGEENFG